MVTSGQLAALRPLLQAFQHRLAGVGWGGRIRTFNLLIQSNPQYR
jgi:hypothetical protein